MKSIHLVLAWLAVTNALTIKIPDFDIGIDLGHYGKPTKTSTTNSKKSTSSSRAATIPPTGSLTVSTLKSATSLPSSAKASGSSKQASSGISSASRSTVSATAPVSSAPSSCTVTVYSTITTTSIPFVTQTTYVGTINYINGDDFEPPQPPGTVQTITNDYTTLIDSTLTVTATTVPPQFLGYTTTVTAYPPSGFIPAQDSLPSAGYDGKYAGGPLQRRAAKRQAGPCITTTSTITSLVVAKTRVSFITDSSSINAVAFPYEDVTVYDALATTYYATGADGQITGTYPYPVTKIVGTPQTNYVAITTTTVAMTQPTATQTIYAACATNNFVDYIQQANGTRNPVNFVTLDRQIDGSFLIASTALNITTAYSCCQYAIENAASVWLMLNLNFCVALYPSGTLGGTQGNCYGQSDPREQFEVSYANNTQVVGGNAYCGQITSSYFAKTAADG